MSTLDSFLRKLCPNGVEHRPMGEIARFRRGTAITAKQAMTGAVPVISGGQKPAFFHNEANRPANCVTVAGSGAYAGFVQYWNVPIFCADSFTVEPLDCSVVLSRFIFHFLKNNQERLYGLKSEGGVPHVYGRDVAKFSIPLPPLAVQEEIVRRLDAMQEIVEALESELALRRKQYETVRERLIDDAAAGAECKTLADIATSISRGSGITRDQVFDDGVPCVRYGEIYTSYGPCFKHCISHTKKECVVSPKYFSHGDILFAITGEKVEDIAKSTAYLGFDNCLAGGDIVVLKHKQNPVYLGHVLCSPRVLVQKRRGKVKSKVVHSSVPEIGRICIPLPPLSVQKEIAERLDAFDELVNGALPAEIAARRRAAEAERERCFAAMEAAG